MGPDVIEAWVDDVAQSEPSVSGLETGRKRKLTSLHDMEANLPRGSHRMQGNDGSEKMINQIDTTLKGSPRTARIIPALAYQNVPQRNDTSPARLSRNSTSVPSRSSQSARPKSQVNRAQNLRNLQKPVCYTRQHERDLSDTMASVSKGSWALFERIRAVANSRRGILPLQLRDYLLLDLGYKQGDDGNWRDEEIAFMFSERKPTITTFAAFDAKGSDTKKQQRQRRQELIAEACSSVKLQEDPAEVAENDLRINEALYKLELLLEMETLQGIIAETDDCASVERSEATWHQSIHGPILELALKGHSQVKAENITSASIARPFQPSRQLQPEIDLQPTTKMIEYALLLKPGPEDPLTNSINEFVDTLQLGTFNQSTYEPLCDAPSGVFIKTRVSGEQHTEAQARLGVWLAAWFERVKEFRSTDDLAIPMIIATHGDWELWFAVNERDCFNVYGPLRIGGTYDLMSIYLLRYCLSCLGDWIATDFRRWVQLCVGAA